MDNTFGSTISRRSSASTTLEEDDESIWDDPNLFNDHAKLMKIKWTKEDMELAHSENFMNSINFTTELILQDPKFNEAIKKPTNTDVDVAVGTLGNILDTITEGQKKCIEVYTECKKKPFWDQKRKTNLISHEQEDKVTKRWTDVMHKFSASFEKAQMLRASRKSMLSTNEKDPEVEKLVDQLEGIHQELILISDVLDCNAYSVDK